LSYLPVDQLFAGVATSSRNAASSRIDAFTSIGTWLVAHRFSG